MTGHHWIKVNYLLYVIQVYGQTGSMDNPFKVMGNLPLHTDLTKKKGNTMEITEQDKRDIKETWNTLNDVMEYLVNLWGNDLEDFHRDMLDSIAVSMDWLTRIEKGENNE